MIKRVNENNSEDFNTLVELLNRTFSDKGKWFRYFMKPSGNHCDGIIEHDNGTQIELYNEEDGGKPVTSLVVVYPNGKSHFIETFDRDDDLLDIADKIYEYVVVKNPVKQEEKKMIRRSRKLESAYNSALNEVRYDVEHKFSPVDLKNGYYIGIDDVQYDYDELSATVFVLNDKDKIVDQDSVSIEVDPMSDYTTFEIRDMTDLMLEKINTVVNSFKHDYGLNESRNRRNEDSNAKIDLFMKQHSELERSLKKAVNDLDNMMSTHYDLQDVLPEDVGRKLEDIYSELAGLERRVREIRY